MNRKSATVNIIRFLTQKVKELGITHRNEKIEAVIRETAGDSFTVDHPRRTLEDFFLNVVDNARKESVMTSGATAGGEIASYLSEGDISETGKEKLARLSGMEPAEEEKTAEEEKPVLTELNQKKKYKE